MANLLAGFVSGASKYGLDQLSRQQEEEREIRKLKLLEQLRKDTAKEMAEFQDQLNRKKPDKDMSTDDLTTGKRTLRNEYGEEVGSLDLPASVLEQYKAKAEEAALDRQYKTKQIENFDADNRRADEQLEIARGNLGISQARLALDKQIRAAEAKGNQDKADSISVGQEIIYRNAKVADDLIRAGVPAEVVQKTAAMSAAQAKARGGGMSDAQLIFLDAASRLRASADPASTGDFSRRFLEARKTK